MGGGVRHVSLNATFHPDHVAGHEWVTTAWRRRGRPARLLHAASTTEHVARFGEVYERLGAFMSDERPVGVARHELALHLRLDGELLDRKVTALRAMATQTNEVVATVGLDAYAAQVAEEAFVDAATREPVRGAGARASR